MGIHRPLLRIFVQGGGVSGELAVAAALGRAVRVMLILALALGAAGAVALAWPGRHGGGPAPVGAHWAGHLGSPRSVAALSRSAPRPWIF
ncbi:MAG: hypothetical protein ACHP9Z_26165 [Streptosporangiales bacterium]